MQFIKIGLFVVLLIIILFYVVKDHQANKSKNNNNTFIKPLSKYDNTNNTSNYNEPLYHSPNDYESDTCGSNGGGGSCGTQKNEEDGCTSCSTPGASTKLLPIMDPMYNMREICKQSILLEDHLFQKKKRCRDCCIKHQLTIEALAEEAITLDKDGECKDLYYLPDRIRELQKDFVANREPGEIAHEYRKLRKSLMQRCFNNF